MAWHNQDLRVNKVRRDWVASEKKLSATPLSLSQGATSTSSGTTGIRPRVAPSSTQSEPVVAHLMGILREALNQALSLSQPRPSRPSRRVATTGEDTLSLNILALFEAAASLSRPISSSRDKSLSRP